MPDTVEAPPRTRFPVRLNPRVNRDFVVSLKKRMLLAQNDTDVLREVSIHIRYVPDRLIADIPQMAAYFSSFAMENGTGIEECANIIADDFSNELIPRWISVTLSRSVAGIEQSAQVQDKKPLWDNPALMRCLD